MTAALECGRRIRELREYTRIFLHPFAKISVIRGSPGYPMREFIESRLPKSCLTPADLCQTRCRSEMMPNDYLVKQSMRRDFEM
jgi:hypothetical protein